MRGIKHLIFVIPVVLLLLHHADSIFRYRSGRNDYYKSSATNVGSVNEGTAHSSQPGKPSVAADAGKGNKGDKGLSAWGIVAIIVGVILFGTGGYYAFVFYPYLCKRERNYDMIELTNVL